MKYIFAIFALAAIAFPAEANQESNQSTPTAITSYKFDSDAYTRLRVVMDWGDPNTTNVFSAKFCPETELMGYNILDLVKGDKSAALTVAVDAPQIIDTNLNLYNITIDRKLFGKDCESSFQRIDFKSPLYLGGQYDGVTVSVTPKLVVAEEPSQLFADGLNGILATANAISPLPAPFLSNKDKLIKRATGQLSTSVGVSDTIQFNIGETGRHSEEWNIPGNADKGVPAIKLKAYFETVPSYFSKPSSGWSASNILSRSFPSGAQFGYSNFRDFTSGLGSSYTGMVAATDLSSFNANCKALQGEIGRQGLTPMDRSLLLWAVALSETNLKDDKKIDRTACMATVFAELGRFDLTKALAPRDPDPVESKVAQANELQMRLTIESDDRFAKFFRTNDWASRRETSEGLFSWPMKFDDSANTGLMSAPQLDLANSDQWQTRYGRSEAAFATKVGCYLFRSGSESDSSHMLAIADFGTQGASLERLVRVTFDKAESDAKSSRVNQFEILDGSGNQQDLALVKSKHTSGCGASGWKPSLLGF